MDKEAEVPAQTNLNQMVLVNQAMDLAVIMRNVRDLAKTASFLNMDDLAELHQIAYKNLKEKMVVNEEGVPGVLMVDPLLSMEAFKLISSVQMQAVETKRKSVDTLLKARALLDLSVPVPADGESEGDPFDEEVTDGAVIQEAGVFGGVIDAADSSDEEVPYENTQNLPATSPEGDSGSDDVVDPSGIPF
jgi:hypothetical protein